MDGFYAGDPGPAMEVPVLQKSGPFRGHAWDMLRTVAPGHPVTYTEYAELSGNVKAVRAAASACAFNAAALFVPCHRVIRTDGSLGGFRWGLAIKESLLAREREQALLANRAEVRLRAHAALGASDAESAPRRKCQRVTGTPAGHGSSSGRSTPSAAAVARRLPRVGVRPASQAAISVSIPLIAVDRPPGVPMATAGRPSGWSTNRCPSGTRAARKSKRCSQNGRLQVSGPRPGAEVGGVDDELAPERQAAVEDDSPAVADGRLPAGVVQRFEGAQGPVQGGVHVGPVFREGVPGGHLDGAGPALVAAVVELDAFASGGEFQLAGHRVGDAADVGQHVAAGPARQFRGRLDVLFAEVWR